jgi:hypothetical protein
MAAFGVAEDMLAGQNQSRKEAAPAFVLSAVPHHPCIAALDQGSNLHT